MVRREIDTKLWKTGNSYVVTIPAKLVKKWGLKVGEDLEVIIKKMTSQVLVTPERSETTKWHETKVLPKKAITKE
jgi:antitoxin component of MazEF toxin-antitoxin module